MRLLGKVLNKGGSWTVSRDHPVQRSRIDAVDGRATGNRMALVRFSVLAVMFGATAGCAPWHQRQTDYPGEGTGIVESRTGPGGDVSARSSTLIPVGNIFVPVPEREIVIPTPGKFRYQIRARDGTLHLVANDAAFDVGACVAFSGYADGPSRTHWSFGRTVMVKSDACGK